MSFPNEPPGSSLIAVQNFNGPLPPSNGTVADANGFFLFAQSVSITTDSAATETPPNVGQWNYFPGMVAGISPGNMFRPLPTVSSLFVGMTWKPSNPWQNESQSNVNKICFILSNNPLGPGAGHFVPTMRGPGPTYTFSIALETTMDNSHLGNGFGDVGGTWIIFPNVSGGSITLGQWHRIEILIVNSSSITARNGTLRVWLNNSLIMNFTNINTPDRWREFAVNPTWGGLNNVKTQNDNFWFDHVRLSNPSIIGPEPTPPTISSFTPTSGTFGTPLTIVGTNFDPNPGGNSVTLNFTPCTVLGAQATQINTAVPNNATTGRLRVATSEGQATSSTDFTVTIPPVGDGLLTGSRGTPANTTLSTEGTLDWAHWGRTTSSEFNHKSGANLISDVTVIGTNGKNHYFGNPTQYAWTGGTPTASATGVHGAIYTGLTNNGFRITAPADTTERILKVYGGAYNATLRVTATLSDNSATPYVDTSFSAAAISGGVNAVWTFRYHADGAGETLTVDILNASAANGNSQLHAATLQLANPPAETLTLSPATLTVEEGATGLLSLTINPVRSTASVVQLTSSDTTKAAVTDTVTIPADTSSVPVVISGIEAGSSTITAMLGANAPTSVVTVIDVPDDPTTPATPSIHLYTSFLDVYRWM